ncbi:uncharacterized protein EI97DRAFT_296884 [Westerdykella ornata]|uniref:Uncharacterized protein n=1 Tax=Westerdykella ornata TaxID=318751 RepID=A0A6A6JM03_WESOR|nr:uncharacterized protein EI97DRAFT_296884 [Westerdykella ornata]KAF2277537.1 hypothetical protein EI97DRAFT_296884 [Westerdykella ornata]
MADKTADKAADNGGSKMLSTEVVAILLAANGISSISMNQYDAMSALDGTRTASSFQHQFRAILRRAKELKARLDGGEKFVPVTPSKKRAAKADDGDSPTKPKKAKSTPSKPKAAAKKAKEKSVLDGPDHEEFADDSNDSAEDFLTGIQEFIKEEKYDDE